MHTKLLVSSALIVLALARAAFSAPDCSSSAGQENAAAPKSGFMLELEAPDGSLRRIRPGEPTLEDPRAEGAWIVRIVLSSGSADAHARPRDPSVAGVRAEVTLVGGDRLRGGIVAGKDDQLTLALAGGARLPLAIDDLRSLVVPEHLPRALVAPLEAPARGDRVYRLTGPTLDRDDGALLGFEGDAVRFESTILGERSIPWSELAALFVEPLRSAAPSVQDEGAPVVVDLADGSRLHARFQRLSATALVLRVGANSVISFPLETVATLTVTDGRIAYLSEQALREETGRGAPFGDEVGLLLGHRVDRSVTGSPLRAGGRTFARGIGTHAPTRLVFDLSEPWTRLRGKLALDDSCNRLPQTARGSVRVRIKLDGELLFESPILRAGDGIHPFGPLALGPSDKKRVLELEVDPIDDFRGDRLDWLDVVLVR